MKSIEELRAIKNKHNNDVVNRNRRGVPTVNVHMGTCGIASGAREVLMAVMEEVTARKLESIHVIQTGCPGMCSNEPMLTVTIPGEDPYIYINLTPENAKSIIAKHIVENQPIREWLLGAV